MGKKSKAPSAPDYTALAEKTAASQKAAIDAQTMANRPNQTDIYGNTSTWTQGPNGQWTQNQTMGSMGQKLLDQQNQMRDMLMGQARDALGNPLSTEGLPDWSNYDTSQLQGVDVGNLGGGMFNMDPIGNSKAIQDATYSLLSPQREMARNSEIQRLKNQGLTEDSPAFQRAIERLDQGDTDAQLKSLLAGTTEYGNQFNRALTQNQSNFGQNLDTQKLAMALRGQQFGEQGEQAKMNANLRNSMLNEQEKLRQLPLQDLGSLMQMQTAGSPLFGNFTNAGASQGVDYMGAGDKQYQAQMAKYNADKASSGGLMSGLMGIGGSILGGPIGGMIGSSIGGMLGGGGGGNAGGFGYGSPLSSSGTGFWGM